MTQYDPEYVHLVRCVKFFDITTYIIGFTRRDSNVRCREYEEDYKGECEVVCSIPVIEGHAAKSELKEFFRLFPHNKDEYYFSTDQLDWVIENFERVASKYSCYSSMNDLLNIDLENDDYSNDYIDDYDEDDYPEADEEPTDDGGIPQEFYIIGGVLGVLLLIALISSSNSGYHNPEVRGISYTLPCETSKSNVEVKGTPEVKAPVIDTLPCGVVVMRTGDALFADNHWWYPINTPAGQPGFITTDKTKSF